MKRFCSLLTVLCLWALALTAQEQTVNLKIVQTSDIHGNYFPYDFILRKEAAGSLARVHTYVQQQRQQYGDNLLLLDNGDFLQGQPTAYYYNYIDTVASHLGAEVLNYMGYDAGNVGNHDIETGRAVFDRWAGDCRFPVLGANIVDAETGRPHFRPYAVFHRQGVKIVVLGMITPAIPVWLPENLWKGLRFDDMEQTARRWMKVIRDEEKPDLVIGLFHSGQEVALQSGLYRDNASVEVAQRVPGFDMVLIGHDHAHASRKVCNVEGDSVWVMDPANGGKVVSDVEVSLQLRDGKVVAKDIRGQLTPMAHYEPSADFLQHFEPQYKEVQAFVNKKIGRFTETISTRPAYFGPSAFVDLIHQLQLAISGAEISFVAPLSFDTRIQAGDICVSDMFNLYKYENMLYTMRLTGREIKDFLEYSYAHWTARMQKADDPLLLLRDQPRSGAADRAAFRYFSYNFDSAAGIRYTVDVTRPEGQKITIECLADGTPFDLERTYRVALNSYRGNGGGGLLTDGAGIPQGELKHRIERATDKDLRFYLMRYIEQQGEISPKPLNQWKFVPEQWTVPAAKRDYLRLFGTESE